MYHSVFVHSLSEDIFLPVLTIRSKSWWRGNGYVCTLNFQLFWVISKSDSQDLTGRITYLIKLPKRSSKAPLVRSVLFIFNWLFVFFRIIAPLQICLLKILSLICDLAFSFFNSISQNRVFNFVKIQLTKSLFDVPIRWCI